MRHRLRLAPVLALCLAGLAVACGDGGVVEHIRDRAPEHLEDGPGDEDQATSTATPDSNGEMSLASSAFENNGAIPVKYTCDGDNVSPPLAIVAVPADAVALALIMHDPDAPLEGGFTHWTIWNIDPSTTEVAENSAPGAEGLNGANRIGYTGPCPPSGTHHYEFTLYALDTVIQGAEEGSAARTEIESAMEGHVLATAELVGTYAR